MPRCRAAGPGCSGTASDRRRNGPWSSWHRPPPARCRRSLVGWCGRRLARAWKRTPGPPRTPRRPCKHQSSRSIPGCRRRPPGLRSLSRPKARRPRLPHWPPWRDSPPSRANAGRRAEHPSRTAKRVRRSCAALSLRRLQTPTPPRPHLGGRSAHGGPSTMGTAEGLNRAPRGSDVGLASRHRKGLRNQSAWRVTGTAF